MFLLQLNKYIAVSFLSEWLASKDLFQLLASTSAQMELTLLEFILLYPNQIRIWRTNEYFPLVKGSIVWLFKKKLLNRLANASVTFKQLRSLTTEQLVHLSSIKKVKFCNHFDANIDQLVKVLPTFANIESIHIFSVNGLKVKCLLGQLAAICHRLINIEIKQCLDGVGDLSLLCRSNPLLRTVDTDKVLIERGNIYNVLLVHCRHIEMVHIPCYMDRLRVVSPFIMHCSTLTSYSTCFTEFPLLVAYHGRRLAFLDVPRSLLWGDAPLADTCPNLTEIHCHAWTMPQSIMNHMPTSCTAINFTQWEASDDLLYALGKACPLVQRLYLGVTSCHVACTAFPCLKDLTIVQYRTSDLIPSLNGIVWRLERLSLSFGTAYKHEEFVDILSNSHLLTRLEIAIGDSMSKIDAITACAAERLTYLKLYVVHIEGQGILNLLKKCTQLTSLHYVGGYMDEKVFQHIGSYCRQLKELNVSSCKFLYSHLKKCVEQLPRLLEIKTPLLDKQNAALESMIIKKK